jgi:hypothetical protein
MLSQPRAHVCIASCSFQQAVGSSSVRCTSSELKQFRHRALLFRITVATVPLLVCMLGYCIAVACQLFGRAASGFQLCFVCLPSVFVRYPVTLGVAMAVALTAEPLATATASGTGPMRFAWTSTLPECSRPRTLPLVHPPPRASLPHPTTSHMSQPHPAPKSVSISSPQGCGLVRNWLGELLFPPPPLSA